MIGRDRRCGVRLDDPLVSRRHALVVGDSGRTRIEDLGSANGLYLNGSRCRRTAPLREGDVVSGRRCGGAGS